ncbi:MAG TPA: FkbM family methyltransferase [Solirubrobacteraceae bacterium]|nr:FkbM family methyltransferase [Solirubrobacteraceae bacterium]
MNPVSQRLHPARIRRTLGAASCVQAPTAFVVNELRGIATVGRYRLRQSGLLAGVRHPLLDMWVLEEVFRFRAYAPPPQVSAALARLARPLRILDLGGHVGYFGLYMRQRYPDARITSFEPDPGNAALLGACIQANGLSDRWELIEACAGTEDGACEFTSNFHLSRIGATDDGALTDFHGGIRDAFPFLAGTALVEPVSRRVRQQDVLPALDEADLVKMDIEGGEWEILADERFPALSATALVLEYHPGYAPGPDADAVVTAALGRAGYVVWTASRGPDGATVWAWKDPGAIS